MRRIAATTLGAAALIGVLAGPALADDPFGLMDDMAPANIATAPQHTSTPQNATPQNTAPQDASTKPARTTERPASTTPESPWIARLGLDQLGR
ncbi:hypothetical protein ACZ90_35760 [Streptomyces albus subsp. albus]|nr:hypothetical protein ACZ90_35760 [Streptomyces albus subsp. albus]